MGYKETNLALNPSGYWRLGETSGINAIDESGNGYTGTYIGGAIVGQPGLVVDDLDKAVQISTGDSIDCPKVVSDGVNFSISMIVNITSSDSGGALACDHDGSGYYWIVGYNASETGHIVYYRDGGNVVRSYSIPFGLVNQGTIHYVAVYTTTGIKIYMNGKLASHKVDGVTITHLALTIGKWSAQNKGIYDEVAMFPYDLSHEQVLDLYRSSIAFTNTPITYEDYVKYLIPESYWRFNENLYNGSLDDNFTGDNGDVPNETLWSLTNDLDGSIENNKAQMRNLTGLATNFEMVGDFDIQVDWSDISYSGGTSTQYARCELHIYDGSTTWQLWKGVHSSLSDTYEINNDAGADSSQYTTTDTFGKFRVKRVSGTLTQYVWNAGQAQWEWNGNTNGLVSTTTTNINIVFTLITLPFGLTDFQSSFDNFIVLNGSYLHPAYEETQHNNSGVFTDYVEYQKQSLIYGDQNNKAIGCDGTINQHIMESSADRHMRLELNDFTFMFSLKCETFSPDTIIIDGRLAIGLFTIGISPTNKLNYTGSDIIEGSTDIDDGGIYHCTIVRRDLNIELYVNGVLEGTGVDTTNYDTELGGLWTLGTPNGNNIDGIIDEFVIYDRAIEVKDITSFWKLTIPNAFNITIDHTLIDEDLYDFPVLVNLDTDSGQANYNTTQIFDVLDQSGVVHIQPDGDYSYFDDDFTGTDGDLPNTDIWEFPHSDPEINTNRLKLQVNNTDRINTSVVTKYLLGGDFSFEFDLDLSQQQAVNTGIWYCFITDNKTGNYFYTHDRRYASGQYEGKIRSYNALTALTTLYRDETASSDTITKRRISRTGLTYNVEYYTSGSWTSYFNGTIVDTLTDVTIYIRQASAVDVTNSVVYLDNFQINSGTISWLNKDLQDEVDIFNDGSCISFWEFDGDVTDKADNYNGTIYGGVGYTGQQYPHFKKNSFPNLSDEYIGFLGLGDWFEGKTELSFHIVAKPRHGGNGTPFLFGVSNTTHADPYYRFCIRFSTTEIYVFIEDTFTSKTISGNYDSDTFYNIIITRSITEGKVYIDGVLKLTISNPGVMGGCHADAMIGRIPATNSATNYALHEVNQMRIFDRILTDQEVMTLANPVTFTKKMEAIYPAVNFDKPIYNVDDDFTGEDNDLPNPVLWGDIYSTYTTTSYDATIQNNKLHMSMTGVNVSGGDNAIIESKFRLSGDFDVQVDFANLIHNNNNASGISLFIQDITNNYLAIVKAQYQISNNFLLRYNDGTSNDTLPARINDFGKFRITRVGTLWTIYYQDGNTGDVWTQHTSYTLSNGDAKISFTWYDQDSGDLNEVDLDNFKLNSGDFYFPTYGDIAKTHHNCKLEIDRWDFPNKQAQLWIKVPYISAQNDTVINLSYNTANDYNDTNTGYTGETPAQDVWTDFDAVYHLSLDGKDSTVNAFDGTFVNMDSSNIVDFGIGKGLTFNGTDENIDLPDLNHGSNQQLSFEFTAQTNSNDEMSIIGFNGGISSDPLTYARFNESDVIGDLFFSIKHSVTNQAILINGHDSSFLRTYAFNSIEAVSSFLSIDGIDTGNNVVGSGSYIQYATDLNNKIGTSREGALPFNGIIKEFRLSKNTKSDSYIASNDKSIKDTLVSYVSTNVSPVVTPPDYELNTRAYYRMDENIGSILYEEMNNYDGTIIGTVNYEQEKLDYSIISGTSLEFTLSGNSYATIPNQNDLQGFSATVKFPALDDGPNNWLGIFSQYIGNSDRFILLTLPTGNKIGVFSGATSTFLLESDDALIAGQKYHIAYKYEPTLLESSLWIDGVKQAITTAVNVFQNNSTNTYLATFENAGGDMVTNIRGDKLIDDVYLFESLTDDDIAILFENSSGLSIVETNENFTGEYADCDLTQESILDIRAFYKCDDDIGSSVLLDDEGLYDGTIINSNAVDFHYPQIDENYQSSYSALFGSDDGYASLPVQNGLQGFACSLITPATFDDFAFIFTQGITSSDRFQLWIDNTAGTPGNLGVFLDTVNVITSNIPLTVNTKYHFAVQYNSDNNETLLWVNGVKQTGVYTGNVFRDNATQTFINEWITVPNAHLSVINVDDIYLLNTMTDADVISLNYTVFKEVNKIFTGQYADATLNVPTTLDVMREYRLDELDGETVLFDTESLTHGTIYGIPTYELDPLSFDIFGGKSMYFPQNSRAEIPNANDIQGFSCTYKCGDITENAQIFDQYTSNADRMILYFDIATTKFNVYLNNGVVLSSNDIIVQDQVYHIALQYDPFAPESSMWIDGVKQTTVYVGSIFKNDPLHTTLFNQYYDDLVWTGVKHGYYDDVYLFNTFSDGQVTYAYESSSGFYNYYVNVGEDCSVDIKWNTKYNMSPLHIIDKGITIFSSYKDLTRGFNYGQRDIIQMGSFAIGGLPVSMHYRLIGNTLVNGIGTKCKVIIYNKDMKQMGSLYSEDDGSFIAQSIHPHKYYHLVGFSSTGECPEITGLTSEIIKSSQDI